MTYTANEVVNMLKHQMEKDAEEALMYVLKDEAHLYTPDDLNYINCWISFYNQLKTQIKHFPNLPR